MNSLHKLVSFLLKINQLGYDPLKIVSFVARIKSLRGTERILNKNCTTLKSRATRLKEVLPMCEQVMRLRIGFSELVTFHTAVIKRADSGNIPMESAAYRVMEDIENYNKFGGMKEQLIKVGNQLFIMNEILGRRNNAIAAMTKLQASGVTDDEILNFPAN